MDQSDRDRLAYLEAEVAALKAKDGRKVLPAPPLEPAVKITRLVPLPTFVMPTDSELQRLREIVCVKYPQLGESAGLADYGAKEQDESAWLEQFTLSFCALGSLHRTEAPDRKRYLSHWIDEAESWLRCHRRWAPTLRFGPFVTAVLSHGDVPYSGLFTDGQVLELGLNAWGIGRAATDAWKKVLETGELLPMSQVASRMAPRSPSRVVIGDHAGW